MKTKNNTELILRKDIQNTPFTAVKKNDKWMLTMGKYLIVSETFDTFEDTENYLNTNHWNITMIITQIILDFNRETIK